MEVRLIEAASEIGAGTRGTSMGMAALRVAAWKHGSELFGHAEESILHDENDVLYEDDKSPNAHHIDGLIRFQSDLAYEVYKYLRNNVFSIVVGGDHSIAIGSVSGTKMAFPKERLGVIWIDAHADLQTPYTTPSGNIHGMPMAASIGEDNLEMKVHDLDEQTAKQWEQLKNMGKINPKVLPEDVVFISLRDFEKEEKHLIDKHGMKVITTAEVRRTGAENVCRKALRHLSDCTDIYMSFDVDSLDSSISKGTGTPVSNGLKEREVEDLISKFMQNRKICCFEITEVNPTLDKENLMAEIAFNILQRSVNVLMMN
jgi:arginase